MMLRSFTKSFFSPHVAMGLCIAAVVMLAGLLNSSAQERDNESKAKSK